jgi:FkbM family methyltransferase
MQRPATKFRNLIYDVGMHVGEDSWYYLKKGFLVVGFEADPQLAESCRNRFREQISQGAMVVVEGAIIDFPTSGIEGVTVEFHQNLANSVWSTTCGEYARMRERQGAPTRCIRVGAVDMRECLARFGIPYYMKIDIEGQDAVCLRALKEFGLKPDYISMESGLGDFGRLRNEVGLLEELGYNAFQAVNQNRISEQLTPSPPREGIGVQHMFQAGSSGLFGRELPDDWRGKGEILRRYRRICLHYKIVGEYSVLDATRSQMMRRRLSGQGSILCRLGLWHLVRRLNPGWYDTHARHACALLGDSESTKRAYFGPRGLT